MENENIWHHGEDGIMEENIEKLRGCLEKLSEDQKICVELFYFNKKSYGEIAEQTHYEMKKVKSFIQNGKRNLKICIENSGDGK